MNLKKINPMIISIGVNRTVTKESEPFSFSKRIVENYELDFISSDYGKIVLNDTVYPLKENDLFFRKPGQTVQGFMPYRFRFLSFAVDQSDKETLLFLNALPDKINIGSSGSIKTKFDEILSLYLNKDDLSALLIKARLLEILYFYSTGFQLQKQTKHLKVAICYMEANFQNEIKICDIAAAAKISPTYLYQQFRAILHDTPGGYLNTIRLEKSKTLLLATDFSSTQIALSCGFRSGSYFSYLFKKHTGLSPTGFRNKYINSFLS